jgi:hypothetical protein
LALFVLLLANHMVSEEAGPRRPLTMGVLAQILCVGLLPMAMASCSATPALDARSGPEVFRVGELEVRLYSNRDDLVRSLPPLFALLSATRVGTYQFQVSGYYDKENKRIYAINDARTVIHEFKHYLEPEWKHELNSAQALKDLNRPPG